MVDLKHAANKGLKSKPSQLPGTTTTTVNQYEGLSVEEMMDVPGTSAAGKQKQQHQQQTPPPVVIKKLAVPPIEVTGTVKDALKVMNKIAGLVPGTFFVKRIG